MIQMYHAVMQTLDLHLEVYYPLPYLAQAIPIALPQREQMLVVAREILLSNERYTAYVEASLLNHPRFLAFKLLQRVLERLEQEENPLSSEQHHYITQGILGLSD